MDKLYERIESMCKQNGVSITTMCKESGASRAPLSDLKMGRSKRLSTETLSKIAAYFGVTVDYLLTGEQKENPTAKSDEVTFDDFTYALHNQSKELNDANKEKLLDMARMLKLAQEAQKNK